MTSSGHVTSRRVKLNTKGLPMDMQKRAADGLYLLTLAFFFSHEVDAAYRHEWRVLPLTSFLPDDVGRELFIWLHVPLFAAILIYVSRRPVRVWLAAFAVAHVLLHWMFRNHPAYEFNTPSSWLLILGAGLFGALYLAADPPWRKAG